MILGAGRYVQRTEDYFNRLLPHCQGPGTLVRSLDDRIRLVHILEGREPDGTSPYWLLWHTAMAEVLAAGHEGRAEGG